MKRYLFLLLFLNATASFSHDKKVEHPCGRKEDIIYYDDLKETNTRDEKVKKYKACVETFIGEQRVAVDNHQKAIDYMLDEWNFLANYLNTKGLQMK